MNKRNKRVLLIASTVLLGLVTTTNVKADNTVERLSNGVKTATITSNSISTSRQQTTENNNYSAVIAAQTVNIPDGYTLDAVKNVKTQAQADELEKIAINGIYNNNYCSNAIAANERVDINNLNDAQTKEMNQYAINLINQTRSQFGEVPFTQNDDTVSTVKGMALKYQEKNESLMNGGWHDPEILQGNSENIAAQQIYIDNISGLRARPFAEAVGRDFADNNNVPVFTVNTMDDLHALIYYGIMGMLFNDASDLFGHAQNFLTNYQPNNNVAVYPSLTYGTGEGHYSNGQTFTFKLENVDMHYIWAGANATTDTENGWQYINDQYVYYQNGKPLLGRQYISLPTINGVGNSWYLVDNGVVQSKVQRWVETYYYFDPVSYLRVDNNYVKSQWGMWYLFGDNGQILTGVQKWAGSYYYFDPVTYLRVDNNYVKSQWGLWYMFGNNGQIVTGKYNWQGSTYYFDPSSYLKVENDYRVTEPDGSGVLLGNSGIALSGIQKWMGSYYYFDPVTKVRVNNNYVRSQWGNWYMVGNDGRVVSGFYNWMGTLYYFDPVTYLKKVNCYLWVNGVRYWADEYGRVVRE